MIAATPSDTRAVAKYEIQVKRSKPGKKIEERIGITTGCMPKIMATVEIEEVAMEINDTITPRAVSMLAISMALLLCRM